MLIIVGKDDQLTLGASWLTRLAYRLLLTDKLRHGLIVPSDDQFFTGNQMVDNLCQFPCASSMVTVLMM
jgi:hypothetical protein